jgi:hypothetical protein
MLVHLGAIRTSHKVTPQVKPNALEYGIDIACIVITQIKYQVLF